MKRNNPSDVCGDWWPHGLWRWKRKWRCTGRSWWAAPRIKLFVFTSISRLRCERFYLVLSDGDRSVFRLNTKSYYFEDFVEAKAPWGRTRQSEEVLITQPEIEIRSTICQNRVSQPLVCMNSATKNTVIEYFDVWRSHPIDWALSELTQRPQFIMKLQWRWNFRVYDNSKNNI